MQGSRESSAPAACGALSVMAPAAPPRKLRSRWQADQIRLDVLIRWCYIRSQSYHRLLRRRRGGSKGPLIQRVARPAVITGTFPVTEAGRRPALSPPGGSDPRRGRTGTCSTPPGGPIQARRTFGPLEFITRQTRALPCLRCAPKEATQMARSQLLTTLKQRWDALSVQENEVLSAAQFSGFTAELRASRDQI